ncbi:hypothetical protein H6G04_18355 [Calothrix membranacea FACHB-236]|nr:hypothetical protein [Calothrix membranacea FACHB-236]
MAINPQRKSRWIRVWRLEIGNWGDEEDEGDKKLKIFPYSLLAMTNTNYQLPITNDK